MNSMLPLVSVLIPCFNAEKYIAGAIQSALDQTYENIEVIVVDDGSTDESLKIIEGFGDRVRWETGANRGGNVARNRLLQLSHGQWLQYLDADDYLLPEKIARQIGDVQNKEDIDIIFSPSVIESHANGAVTRSELEIPEPHDLWILLARWYLPQTGASLWRKDAINTVGGWKPDQPCCQEHELYLRLLKASRKFSYCSGGLSVYRHWGRGTVSTENQQLVRRERRIILDETERFLSSENELSEARKWAINMARFEMARKAWADDRNEAREIYRELQRSDQAFRPDGDAAPSRYRRLYSILGFELTERLAALIRSRV